MSELPKSRGGSRRGSVSELPKLRGGSRRGSVHEGPLQERGPQEVQVLRWLQRFESQGASYQMVEEALQREIREQIETEQGGPMWRAEVDLRPQKSTPVQSRRSSLAIPTPQARTIDDSPMHSRRGRLASVGAVAEIVPADMPSAKLWAWHARKASTFEAFSARFRRDDYEDVEPEGVETSEGETGESGRARLCNTPSQSRRESLAAAPRVSPKSAWRQADDPVLRGFVAESCATIVHKLEAKCKVRALNGHCTAESVVRLPLVGLPKHLRQSFTAAELCELVRARLEEKLGEAAHMEEVVQSLLVVVPGPLCMASDDGDLPITEGYGDRLKSTISVSWEAPTGAMYQTLQHLRNAEVDAHDFERAAEVLGKQTELAWRRELDTLEMKHDAAEAKLLAADAAAAGVETAQARVENEIRTANEQYEKESREAETLVSIAAQYICVLERYKERGRKDIEAIKTRINLKADRMAAGCSCKEPCECASVSKAELAKLRSSEASSTAAHAEIVRKIESERTKEAQLQAQLAAHKLLCNARISRARKEEESLSNDLHAAREAKAECVKRLNAARTELEYMRSTEGRAGFRVSPPRSRSCSPSRRSPSGRHSRTAESSAPEPPSRASTDARKDAVAQRDADAQRSLRARTDARKDAEAQRDADAQRVLGLFAESRPTGHSTAEPS